jgi:hypothetical protein
MDGVDRILLSPPAPRRTCARERIWTPPASVFGAGGYMTALGLSRNSDLFAAGGADTDAEHGGRLGQGRAACEKHGQSRLSGRQIED